MPGDINIVMTTLSIFEMLLNDAIDENPDEYAKFITSWFQAAISYAVVWGLSGIMNTESRIKFDEFYREVIYSFLLPPCIHCVWRHIKRNTVMIYC